ncbi:Nucleotidyltransferase domain-containing protein [Desulfonispora thiosulfatigenes DSM 11270]|uniref:Nucleotidyltransferase domain-containing protein n=1 Tax=Desulfonispora thiosulfatigenes DSM 11270 TaxID=656914 RepID=A0A1W1VDQ1_DESTI|nr:nucleotidyltransferase domain-containing protein [Desulfonispora thiosulfatigenes]SMB91074.1 Nucleotidyltransferase domain-containing protein [Desulfonispora thiosulfatigenes DSM 11270]
MEENEQRKITDYLRDKLSPYLIIIFGSFAKESTHKNSDLDVAFISEKKFSDYELFMIAQRLADIIGREVDLIDLTNASTVFQAQIIGTGKVIYCSDEQKRMLFELTALKKYTRLNEERKFVIEKIKESGRVYGK